MLITTQTKIAELRAEIPKDIDNFLNKNPDVLVLRYQPGVGKTTNTIKYLDDLGIVFGFFGAKHSTLEENISKPYGFLHLEGKSRKCENPKKEEFEHYQLLDSSAVCANCEKRQFCEYHRIQDELYQQPQSFVAVHQHYTNLKGFMEEIGFQLIVFDENFLDSLEVGGTFTIEDLYQTEKLVLMMQETVERNFILDAIRNLILFVYTGEFDVPNPGRLELEKFAIEYQNHLVARIYEGKWAHKNIISDLASFLIVTNEKVVLRKVVYEGKRKTHVVDLVQYDFSSLNTPIPILILDATTPADIYKKIMKQRKVKVVEPGAEATSHCYQLTSHSYPMTYLKRDTVRKELFGVVRDICEKHTDREIFIVIRKRFKKYLEAALEGVKNAHIAHYGGLRGANTFVNADVAILVGTPFPNPDIVDLKAQVMGVTPDSVFEMECNQEMLQTIHRIRPLLKDETWVYLLSNIDTHYECNDMKKLTLTHLKRMFKNQNKRK